MEFTISERLMLLNLLPKEGDIITLRMVRDLQTDLGFSAEELEALELKQTGERIEWRAEAATPKEVKIPPRAFNLISELLRTANEAKKLNIAQLDLYEKFVEPAEHTAFEEKPDA